MVELGLLSIHQSFKPTSCVMSDTFLQTYKSWIKIEMRSRHSEN
jgi:hypothetical protein